MLETRASRHDEDLDKDDRMDKWRIAVWVMALFFLAAITWIMLAQTSTAETQATKEASQKFTLAQQITAACDIKTQADDLGGLCASATQIVKEGPAGTTGKQGAQGVAGTAGDAGATGADGPLGPKGEQGIQGIQGEQGLLGAQGIFGKTGSQGTVGIQGSVGSSGSDGTNGANGADGKDGQTGPTGADGNTGATGDTGARGPAAYPFTFTFTTVANGTYTCTIVEPDATASCTSK